MCRKCATPKPPTLQQVKFFFAEKGLRENMAAAFYYYQKSEKWTTAKGCPIRNWKRPPIAGLLPASGRHMQKVFYNCASVLLNVNRNFKILCFTIVKLQLLLLALPED